MVHPVEWSRGGWMRISWHNRSSGLRHRGRLALVGVLATASVAAGGSLMAVHADASPPDFLLVRVVAGPAGASNVAISATGTVTQVGSGTLVAGTGGGLDLGGYKGGTVLASDVLSTGVTLGTGADRGGLSLSVSSPTSLVFGFSGGVGLAAPAMKPGDKLDFVVFFPNGELLSSNYTVTTAAGSVETTSTQGSGSATLDVAAAGDGGSAVAVNGIATGANAHQAIPSVGIVGTIMTNCDACTGTWTTPDGHSGAWEVPSSTFGSEFQFVGPAGSWNWTWTG